MTDRIYIDGRFCWVSSDANNEINPETIVRPNWRECERCERSLPPILQYRDYEDTFRFKTYCINCCNP